MLPVRAGVSAAPRALGRARLRRPGALPPRRPRHGHCRRVEEGARRGGAPPRGGDVPLARGGPQVRLGPGAARRRVRAGQGDALDEGGRARLAAPEVARGPARSAHRGRAHRELVLRGEAPVGRSARHLARHAPRLRRPHRRRLRQDRGAHHPGAEGLRVRPAPRAHGGLRPPDEAHRHPRRRGPRVRAPGRAGRRGRTDGPGRWSGEGPRHRRRPLDHHAVPHRGPRAPGAAPFRTSPRSPRAPSRPPSPSPPGTTS